ncbi:uncharacterized protein LOC143062260 [Mytilus galloprovincialis]|uniref:uncharacterized protein LOC143062260 n=1 Tax=Mytilus galloprovincialis TaxID=29158 RepID=UPI003F7C2451
MRGNETNEDKNDSQDTEKEYDSFYQSPKDDSFEEPSNTPHKPKKKGRPKGTPPRKAPNFITPPKKSLFRKRKATPETWKKNIRKKLRLSGKEYISVKGTVVEEKKVKPIDCSKCTFKCSLSIDDEHRQQIFKTFWSLDTNDRKKDFIIANTTQKKTRTYLDDNNEPVKKKKNVHRSYSLNVDGNHVKICKKFFLTTLGISETFASNALQNQQDGVFIGEDKRGKHMPHNKTTKTAMELVRRHIESFPVVDGHYTRKDSNRKYLGADLNIKRMYELYIVQCKDQIPEKDIVSQAVYRKIFNEEYNFSFHVPKKDQCAVCTIYHQRNNERTLTNDIKKAYDKHQERKIKAREEKKKDKESAKSSPELFVGTFDLQAVLQTPCSLVSQLYYMRKLNCYNLSIYNLANYKATCYLWSEVDAQRGSCEIGTCLYLQLLSMSCSTTHDIFYSDACSGQNRNQFIASCLLHVVNTHQTIKVIDHKFLESGHTQMECDSMHSAIEFAKKKTEIFVPQQWATVMRMARRKDPYMIVPLKYGDIYDFKDLSKKNMKFRKEDVNGKKIKWLKIRWLRYTKENPDCILFKYKMDDEFCEMKVSLTSTRGRSTEEYQLIKKYTSQQSISAAKKKDLVGLCKKGIIPSEYHEYYKSLPANINVKDTLAETDVEEEKNDSYQD